MKLLTPPPRQMNNNTMTPEEQKYQEFRAMGYDHIQARQMTLKHFEITKTDKQ